MSRNQLHVSKLEELQTLLPLAVKACGYSVCGWIGERFIINHPCGDRVEWNPSKDVIDCAEMNAALMLNTAWHETFVWVGSGAVGISVEHDGTQQDKMRAWMEASVRAAAKVGEKK